MNEIKKEHIKKLDILIHSAYKHLKHSQINLESQLLQGITSTELSVLSIVDEKPDIILKEISERLDLPASTLTSAVDRLEQRNLIKRTISKKDRRSFGLELTETGLRLHLEHEESEQLVWEKILGSLSNDEERESFLFFLEKIIKEFN